MVPKNKIDGYDDPRGVKAQADSFVREAERYLLRSDYCFLAESGDCDDEFKARLVINNVLKCIRTGVSLCMVRSELKEAISYLKEKRSVEQKKYMNQGRQVENGGEQKHAQVVAAFARQHLKSIQLVLDVLRVYEKRRKDWN